MPQECDERKRNRTKKEFPSPAHPHRGYVYWFFAHAIFMVYFIYIIGEHVITEVTCARARYHYYVYTQTIGKHLSEAVL
jgi:hypothetical protein